jgi:hypothetical protein
LAIAQSYCVSTAEISANISSSEKTRWQNRTLRWLNFASGARLTTMDQALATLRHEQAPNERDLVTGSVVQLADSVTFAEDGGVVLGGSPFSMLIVNKAVTRLLRRWQQPTTLTENANEAALARRLERSGFLHVNEVIVAPDALSLIHI